MKAAVLFVPTVVVAFIATNKVLDWIFSLEIPGLCLSSMAVALVMAGLVLMSHKA